MAKLYNLARMNTATTGTGTITLSTAVSGCLTFAQAGVQNGEEVSYGISDGSNSEVGRGTYNSSTLTLTRNVLKSTNSNNAIDLSGTAQVYITVLAEDLVSSSNNSISDISFRVDGSLYPSSGVYKYVVSRNCSIDKVYITADSLGTAGVTVVDVNKNGTSIFTDQTKRPQLNYNDADLIAISQTPDTVTCLANDILSFDIDTVASGVIGLGVTVSVQTTLSGYPSYPIIQLSGVNQPQRNYINFVSSGIVITDDSINNKTNIAINPPTSHITLLPLSYSAINQGDWNLAGSASSLLYYYLSQSTPANNDNVSYQVYLTPGVYSILLVYHKNTTGGIMDIDVDGVEIGSVEQGGSLTWNQRYLMQNINISTAGLKTITCRMDGKNIGSGYKGWIVYLALWRTG